MARPAKVIGDEEGRRLARIFVGIVVFLVALWGIQRFGWFAIETAWWSEVGQLDNFYRYLLYESAPGLLAGLLLFALFWVAHARGLKKAGTGLAEHPVYAKLSTVGLFLAALFLSGIVFDGDTLVRYLGGRGLASASGFHDPAFGLPLAFYLFDLPFYSLVLSWLLLATVATAILYWGTARLWGLRESLGSDRAGVQVSDLHLHLAFESGFVRLLGAAALVALACKYFLDRYELVFHDHGFMVGVDYTDTFITLPLQWLAVVVCLGAAVLLVVKQWKLAGWSLLLLIVPAVFPGVVNSIYVKPNEISLQRDYIARHILSTRAAYGLDRRIDEKEFAAKLNSPVNVDKNRPLLDNLRLWDLRAFHDTVTQIQSLRTYYSFVDTDVDRYVIDGKLRQLMITPRELDVQQLPEAKTRWINPHFIYTHGYGIVMAEANRITPDGLPEMLIQDAPPKVNNASLKLTRPEIYFGEMLHEPVFVHTSEHEFNYPSGSDNVHNTYAGMGGFPVSRLDMRMAAALYEGDANILLTGYLTSDSRMMIRRRVRDRVGELARFVRWDTDPYLVLTGAGRLMWMIDGYTTSMAHPYSRAIEDDTLGEFNYIRNSVKATVDAYDGEVKMYVFDPGDPIIRAYQNLFPGLLLPAEQMPAELRAHARYPEMLFRAQADIYRIYHMRQPDSFYNREDSWDVAGGISGQDKRALPIEPTYMVATLPGESQPEFLLMLPFTPRNKQNLVGVMAARCDGPHLGELVVLQLSKQALVFGPMQIEARIDQDGTISKDLTLWNQQGSQVVRGRMLVLPVDQTIMYVEPLYIRSSQASMPQLKKIVIAVGNSLIYTDTYQQALAQLGNLEGGTGPVTVVAGQTPGSPIPVTAGGGSAPAHEAGQDARLSAIRDHLRRYRELSAQGKWAEAGKELEAIEGVVH